MNSRADLTSADFTNFNLVKICGPRLPAGLIERKGLDAAYAALRSARLGSVRAPAGSGKTSLLLQWRGRLLAEGAHVVWLSLDAEDDDPWSFFRYLGAALLQCGLPKLEALKSGYETPAHAVGAQSQVAQMLHALSEEESETFIFLDDFHHIADEQILLALAALLQSAPPNLHLVLAGRALPKIPLGKLRAAGELVEIDYASLRFSADECDEFYRKSEHLAPRGSDLARLAVLTDGWPAGLRLLEIALRNKRPADLPSEELTRNRNLQDYLLEAVLNGLPPDLLSFLTETSILNRLCGSLCDAVTGNPGCQDLIEEIERQGLFLCALDDHRGWYAYHPLFAEMLRQRLSSQQPDLLIALHRRAASWFLSHRIDDEALLHALAARDDALAVDLIERGAVLIEALTFRNFDQVLTWHRHLPPEVRRRHPKLYLLLAFHCLVKVNWREAAALLEGLDALEGAADYAVDALGMRSIVAYYKVDVEAAIRDAEAFLAQREAVLIPSLERAVLDHLSGAYFFAGRMADADRVLAELERMTKQVPLSYAEAQRQKIVILFDGYFRGHFKEGVSQASDVMDSLCARYLMESQMGSVAAILLIVGLHESGEVERTIRLLEDWSDVIERHSISTVFAALHRVWTRVIWMPVWSMSIERSMPAASASKGRPVRSYCWRRFGC
jgi:LuxR family maltose regulon positive regulatory protein